MRVGEKDAVAERAAALVKDGETVLLDIGTTAHRLARRLRGRNLTVVTSNMAVYEELADDAGIELVLLGGMLRREYRSLVGFLTEDNLRQVHADHLFLGTSGVRPDGRVMDTTVVEVPVKRAMIAASDRVILLADSAKFPGTGVATVCGPEALNTVVTDAPVDARTASALREAGVTIVEAVSELVN
jgi:DeoR/GlpR family transcriptional regulator of sugar metabolism